MVHGLHGSCVMWVGGRWVVRGWLWPATPSVPQNFGKLSFEARNKGSANRMMTFDSSLESPGQDGFIDNKFIKINIFNQCQIWEKLLQNGAPIVAKARKLSMAVL